MTEPPTQTASDISSCQLCARICHIITETDKALCIARCCKTKLWNHGLHLLARRSDIT